MKKKKIKQANDIVVVAVIIVTVLISFGGIYVLSTYRQNNNSYTYEEILHDHDGDGIPDHGTDYH